MRSIWPNAASTSTRAWNGASTRPTCWTSRQHLLRRCAAGAPLAADIARRQVVYQRRAGSDAQLSPWLAHRNHMHPAVHRAQDAIARDPACAWSMDELAQVAFVSPRHLSRLFAEHAGTTALAYRQSLRVARAALLLERSDLQLERVAEQAGFASARDFRRVWQRYRGTPLQAVERRRHDLRA